MPGFDVAAARKAGYSEDEILQHLVSSRKFDIEGAKKAGYSATDIINHLSSTAPPARQPAQPQGSAVSRLAGNAWEEINPINIVKNTAQAVTHPLETLSGMSDAQAQLFHDARAAYEKGDYALAGRRALEYLIPVLGPAIAKRGDQAAAGDVAGAVGGTLGLGATIVAPEFLPKAVKVAAAGSKAEPVQSAMRFAERNQIPVDLATSSDNQFVRGVQQVSSSSLGGSIPATVGKRAQAARMAQVSGELAERVHPQGMTPTEAGRSLPGTLEVKAGRFEEASHKAYGKIADLEADPKHLDRVQVSAQVSPEAAAQLDDLAKSQAGQPYDKLSPARQKAINDIADRVGIDARPTPVYEDIPLAVDVRGMKEWAQPTLEKLKQRWKSGDPKTAQIVGQQIKSLESILAGPDFKPASIAEKDLSAFKALVRETDPATEASMRGVQAVDQLQTAIDTRIAAADPKALRTLQRARATWATKADVEELARRLREEPGQVFEQASFRDDNGIEFLRRVNQRAPEELPKIGRAWLQKQFEQASAQGGWTGGKSMWKAWQNLGPETKALLYKDPLMRSDLNDFFLLAKRMEEVPNPSGTAAAATAGRITDVASAALAGKGDVLGAVLSQVAPAVLTSLLYSPKFVRMVNKGLRAPVASPARVFAAGNVLMQAKKQPNLELPSGQLSTVPAQ